MRTAGDDEYLDLASDAPSMAEGMFSSNKYKSDASLDFQDESDDDLCEDIIWNLCVHL